METFAHLKSIMQLASFKSSPENEAKCLANALCNLEQKDFSKLNFYICMAFVGDEQAEIVRFYDMYMYEPKIKVDHIVVKSDEDIILPLSIIGDEVELSDFYLKLIKQDAHKDAIDLLQAHEHLSGRIQTGGFLHIKTAHCLALLQE